MKLKNILVGALTALTLTTSGITSYASQASIPITQTTNSNKTYTNTFINNGHQLVFTYTWNLSKSNIINVTLNSNGSIQKYTIDYSQVTDKGFNIRYQDGSTQFIPNPNSGISVQTANASAAEIAEIPDNPVSIIYDSFRVTLGLIAKDVSAGGTTSKETQKVNKQDQDKAKAKKAAAKATPVVAASAQPVAASAAQATPAKATSKAASSSSKVTNVPKPNVAKVTIAKPASTAAKSLTASAAKVKANAEKNKGNLKKPVAKLTLTTPILSKANNLLADIKATALSAANKTVKTTSKITVSKKEENNGKQIKQSVTTSKSTSTSINSSSPAPKGPKKDDDKPKSPLKLSKDILNKNKINAEDFKKDYLGKNVNGGRFDLYEDKATKDIWIYDKDTKTFVENTGEKIK